jgi:hypothetical protein
MEAIITALQDVIKLQFVNMFKNEDPYYANTMIFAYMSIISAIFLIIKNIFSGNTDQIKNLYKYYYYCFISWRDENGTKFNPKIVAEQKIPSNYSKWIIYDDTKKKDFLLWLLYYFPNNENIVTTSGILHLYTNRDYMLDKLNIENPEDIKKIKLMDYAFLINVPIFYYRGEVLYYSFEGIHGYLHFQNYGTAKILMKKINQFIKDKKIHNKSDETNIYKIYNIDNDGLFYPESNINKHKTFENMVLHNKQNIQNILDEFKNKQNSQNPYDIKNLGYLLYGPPGTGKTNFIKAVCNYLKKNAVIVDMRKIISMKILKKIFSQHLSDSIFVFDEIDHLLCNIINKKEKNKEVNNNTKIHLQVLLQTMSETKDLGEKKKLKDEYSQLLMADNDKIDYYSLLTFLDGIIEHEGRVIIGTTNHIESIPPELRRPGRFDHVIHFDRFIDSEIKELLYKLYNKNTKNITFPDRIWSPAEIINFYNSGLSYDQSIDILIRGKTRLN